MKKICGIYKITNIVNGHMYIGLSRNCYKRWSDHKTKAIHSSRADDVRKVLYVAMRKYGIENFTFEILEECSIEQLDEREKYWIAYYNTFLDRKHYNRDPGGNQTSEHKIMRGEKSPAAKLTEADVLFCRELYSQGNSNAKEVWELYFQDKIAYSGFQRCYTGKTWSHIRPEVLEKKFGNRRFTYEDALYYKAEFNKSGLTLNQYSKTVRGFVGYGSLYKMVYNTEFYNK